jgi:FixJ family two-component response regulator
MPNLGGRRVYELIKGINQAVLVLFTSGYSAHVAQRRFIMGEPMEFLQKPYKWQVLLRRIREMLDKSLQTVA